MIMGSHPFQKKEKNICEYLFTTGFDIRKNYGKREIVSMNVIRYSKSTRSKIPTYFNAFI